MLGREAREKASGVGDVFLPCDADNLPLTGRVIVISSPSSFHAASTDLPDSLLPPISIVHRSREVFQATSSIGTELLYVGSS